MTEIINRQALVRESNAGILRILRAAGVVALVASALCLAGGASALSPEYDFVGVAKCRTCHKKDAIGNQYGVWLDGKHAKAYETLASDEAKKWAAEAGVDDPQNDDKCLKCHVTAHGVPEDRLSRKFDKTLGVQCETCHGAGKGYTKKRIMADLDLARSKGLKRPTAEDCVTCHNDESPAWKPDRYTRDDGSKVGFDFEQAAKKIAHPVPEGYDSAADGGAD